MKGNHWMRLFVWGVFFLAAAGGQLAAQEWAQVQKALLQKGSAMANNLAKSRKDLSRAYDALDAIAPHVHYASRDVLPWSFRVLPRQENGFEQAAVLRNNRLELASRLLFEHTIRRLRTHREDIKQNLQYARTADLASLIPAEAKFIFLGEVHHQPVIEQQILYILAHYRKRYPERKIMVLTEFVLDTDVSLLPREMDQRVISKRAFFDLLMKWRIPIFGLEEPAARAAAGEEIFSETGNPAFLSATALSVQTRNRHWIKQIQAMHESYPDMIFFIYAGLGHTEYNFPAAVSAAFNPKETFAMDFFVGKRLRFTPFDRAFSGAFSGPGVWYWKDPRYARLAGFDVSVVLPARK